MTYDELVLRLNTLGVTPPDICRASLYLDHIENAVTFFNTTLADPLHLDVNYPFVRTAVRSASILNELAQTLDFYVAPAVDAALFATAGNNWTYRQYFDNQIFGAGYPASLLAFRALYTVSSAALPLLYAHFTGNIEQACTRIVADRAMLTNFFADMHQYHFTILSLDKIKSTGSDFHKGGKQVLILTFNTTHNTIVLDDVIPMNQFVKIVYKPSDIEADCLLAGNSAAVNNVIPGFMAASLFEIYNAALRTYLLAHPDFANGEEIPIYRILPRNYISPHAGGGNLPIRNAYGYIQYLDNDLQGTSISVFGYYPFGASDYLIFADQDTNAIVNKFYKIEGALAALACTFSIQDIHLENLRVKNYLPYFIDLEISLNKSTAGIRNTSLIDSMGNAIGGINGVSLVAQDFHWVVDQPDNPGHSSIRQAFDTVYYQNRLWEAHGNSSKQIIPVNTGVLINGFTAGMTILQAAQQAGDFNAWFVRLNHVLVRYIPFATAFFKNNLISPYYLNPDNATRAVTLNDYLMGSLTGEYNAYVAGDDPKFLALTPAGSLADIQNLDVPIFYYRIGTQEIVDSNGAQLLLPAAITIFDNNHPPNQVQANPNYGRATFFANVPTNALIDVAQVQILTNALAFAARRDALNVTILAALGVAGTPNNPTAVIPINQ